MKLNIYVWSLGQFKNENKLAPFAGVNIEEVGGGGVSRIISVNETDITTTYTKWETLNFFQLQFLCQEILQFQTINFNFSSKNNLIFFIFTENEQNYYNFIFI